MPYVSGPFAFWHMPKAGGTFLRRFLMWERPGTARVGEVHDPARCMDALGLSGARHVGLLRPPWGWYPSLYRHAGRSADPVATAWLRAHAPDGSFRSWLGSVLSRSVPPPLGIVGTGPDFPASGGLWTRTVRYMYEDAAGHPLVPELLDSDRLHDALEELFGLPVDRARHGVHADAEAAEGRAGGITDYRGWYDSEMLSWVAEADGRLASSFGLSPWMPSPAAVHRACPACFDVACVEHDRQPPRTPWTVKLSPTASPPSRTR